MGEFLARYLANLPANFLAVCRIGLERGAAIITNPPVVREVAGVSAPAPP